jgi:hypothetical protein
MSLVAGLTGLGIAQPAAACACGAPTPPDGVRVTVGQEQALVTFDGASERIDLVLDMLSDGAETGLVLPTPTPATVTLGDVALFEALDRQTEPEVVVRQDWWGGAGDGAAGGAPPTVLSEVDLGPVQAVTLAASDADGLREWLDANGYGIAPGVQALLGDYVERGWSFAALKLTGEQSLEGQLEPVRFEFATEAAVYPLLLSQASTQPQSVRLYLVGEDRMAVAFPDGAELPGDVSWAGPIDEPELMPLGAYLTVVDAYFFDPAAQITGDLDIRSTGQRTDFSPVTERTEFVQLGGVPLGVVLLVVGALLVAMLAVVLIGGASRAGRTGRRR